MDERAQKISATMRAKGIDNAKAWREQMRIDGVLPSYQSLEKNGDLAELIGVILGDGHIYAHERCDSLRIVGNSNSPGFAQRYADIIERVFGKRPSICKRRTSNAFNITLYQKHIASRLDLPTGSREELVYVLPGWIDENSELLVRFLRGLYEAEGSLNHHEPTYTHKLIFTNTNESLLNIVEKAATRLGFHPHRSKYKIQLSREEEVQKFVDLLQFRSYKSSYCRIV